LTSASPDSWSLKHATSRGEAIHPNSPAGRYAPSPTGDLHLGNLRTALLAWLFARASGRAFRLRVEDLDAARVRPGMAERQQQDLAALGLTFDGEPMVQSERSAAYRQALARLADRTYECFCSRREIAEATLAPHGAPRSYPGTCRALTGSERDRRRQTRTPALRVRADGAVQTVLDELRGRVTRPVDDFVVQRNDGVTAYMLAVVVDDAAMGVDQVVRGDDLLAAAPDQAWLATVLGLPVPAYAHVPLVLNAAGGRLAKRDGAVTLTDLTAAGIGSGAVLGMLATSLGLAAPGEPVTVELLLERFDPSLLPTDPWLWDPRNGAPAQPGV
jgi:glutamyl-tRNA synthetase